MFVCEVSLSVPEHASIDSAKNLMASVSKPSTRLSVCICSCYENFEVAHHPNDLSHSKSGSTTNIWQLLSL